MNTYIEQLKKEILPNNKHSEFLIRILEKRLKEVPDNNLYSEIHHIIPRSWGGNDNKENLLVLKGSEHFKVHQLLCEVTIDKEKRKQMFDAFWLMSHLDKYEIKNHKEFEKFKKEYSKCLSEKMSGSGNNMYGKSIYDVWVQKYGKKEADERNKEKTEKRNMTMKNKDIDEIIIINKKKACPEKSNPMYGKIVYDVWVEKYGIDEANKKYKEMTEKQSLKNKGENNNMHGRKPYDIWLEKYGKEEADKKQAQMIQNRKNTWAKKRIISS